MTIPLAVSPSQRTPGVYVVVNLLAGPPSPGDGALRVALLAQKTSAGDLTVDTEVREGGGADSAAVAFGPGGLGHLAAKRLYAQYQAAQVDFAAVGDGSGTGTIAITAAGSPTTNQVADVDIHGRQFEVVWLSGENAATFAARFLAAVNALGDDLFVSASAGSTGVTNLNAKSLGNVGNDVLVKVKLRYAQSANETLTGAVTYTALSGGSSDPDYTNVLASLNGREYHFILMCLSNADAKKVDATNNAKRGIAHINGHNTGLDAKLETLIVGFTGQLSEATATTVDSDSFGNCEFAELPFIIAGRDLPCEVAGWECGDWLLRLSTDAAANRIGTVSPLYGAADKIASKPSQPNIETALANGVSIFDYTPAGAVVMRRPVTTHSQTDLGAPDGRLLDMQNVHGTYIVTRTVRDGLPLQFPQAKITKDTPPGEDPPPKGVIEERDVKGYVITVLRDAQRDGTVTQASVDAAIADGSLVVQVNDSDDTQVDIVMPFKIVPPLAKFGVVANRVPN